MFDLGSVQTPEDPGEPGGAGPGTSSSAGGAAGASSTAQSTASGSGAGGGGGGVTGGSGGAAGAGGAPPLEGCADGERDGYLTDPDIAACAGGFAVPGVGTSAKPVQECPEAGNQTNNQTGMGCAAANLCGASFHVCTSAQEVGLKASSGQCPTDVIADSFWLTQQSLDGDGDSCVAPTQNNVVGCGDIGPEVPDGSSCGPLTHYLRKEECGTPPAPGISPWQCGDDRGGTEANTISKPDPAKGGVLCCRTN
jgi:hypothetical protein